MTEPIVRLYETEQQARDAYAKLMENGFSEARTVVVAPPGEGDAGAALAAAMRAAEQMGDRAAIYAERVQAGRTLLVTTPNFGMAETATRIMDGFGPVDTDLRIVGEPDPWGPGAPFSATLYWPPLMKSKPAPFSDLIGFPTLSPSKSYTELSSGLSWLSSMIPPLTSPNFAFSKYLAMPLLLRVAAPFSAITLMPTLIRQRGTRKLSLGLPILWRNPTPFSSLLSLPVLAKPH
ncbi:MAG: hypothetical protein ACOCYE_02765 [Pseudomonadota bacterium]